MQVREAEDRDCPEEGHRPEDDEGGSEREPLEAEDEEDHQQSGEGAGLAESQPCLPRMAPLFASVVRLMPRAVLGLHYSVEAEAGDRAPRGRPSRSRLREREQGVAEGEIRQVAPAVTRCREMR